MANYNTVFLMGRLTDEPKKIESAKSSITTFSIAVNRYFTNASNEKKEEADFFDIKCFGKLAEIILEYGNKGKEVFVTGRLSTDRWKTPEGDNRSRVVVIASEIQLLGGRSEDSKAKEPTKQPAKAKVKAEEDTPF